MTEMYVAQALIAPKKYVQGPMDTAKAVGHEAGAKWASVPTVVSTDTPTSALSVTHRRWRLRGVHVACAFRDAAR